MISVFVWILWLVIILVALWQCYVTVRLKEGFGHSGIYLLIFRVSLILSALFYLNSWQVFRFKASSFLVLAVFCVAARVLLLLPTAFEFRPKANKASTRLPVIGLLLGLNFYEYHHWFILFIGLIILMMLFKIRQINLKSS
jgi:hypothetical protein